MEAIAKNFGAKGLAFIKIESGEWKSPIVKFFSEAEKAALQSKLALEEGDLIFFAADKWDVACEVLGRLRLRVAEIQGLTKNSEVLDFLWVTDFPLLQFDAAENKWNAVHHPFTRPHPDDLPLLDEKRYGEMRAEAYDVVLNGVEIGGGSIRIHEPELQAKMFGVLGDHRGAATIAVRPSPPRLSVRRAASRRHRARPRPARHVGLRRTIDSRGDGIPEEQPRPGSHVAVAE